MPAHDLLWKTKGTTDLPHLVFEKSAQRLNELELKIFRQTSNIMVAFDLHRDTLSGLRINIGASALNNIRIQGTLGQIIKGAKALTFLFEHTNKFVTNQLALLLWICHPGQFTDKAFARFDVFHSDMEFTVKEIHEKLRLSLSHKALINKHAGELIANRPVQQKGQRRRINSPRQS